MVTERRRYQTALERQARTDVLTGLLNRNEGLDRVKRMLSHPPRRGTQVAVAFCDLDHFKDVNDRWGHIVGDALLQATAERIRASVREQDLIVGLGGDEILVILAAVHGIDNAVGVAEGIRTAVAPPVRVGDVEVTTTVRVGVTLASAHEDIDSVVARADGAMYEAKSAGGDRVAARERA